MKQIFIKTKYKGEIDIPDKAVELLPEKVVVCTTIQYIDQVEKIKKTLEDKGKKVELFRSMHSKTPGQIVGCDIKKVDGAVLYVGDGMFHPKALLYENESVFVFNPITGKFLLLDDIEIKKKRKRAMLGYAGSKNIGVIFTTKRGQSKLGKIKEIKERLERQGKCVYLFLSDTINTSELENFNFIDFFVNTACPRIFEDNKKIINYKDVIILDS